MLSEPGNSYPMYWEKLCMLLSSCTGRVKCFCAAISTKRTMYHTPAGLSEPAFAPPETRVTQSQYCGNYPGTAKVSLGPM
ncbi:hypothetical protein PoB_005226900 [Plakobranchus ocellatus]|uniref:Uncharacterized protein n=1 Tax=Plakobranchus ocellatus TaxID=259542 RepID=A0AAV4C3R3_9GAST|nr:hypothetical protein PoB_005226900 [Plakobranchus ocellatus]